MNMKNTGIMMDVNKLYQRYKKRSFTPIFTHTETSET